MPSIVQASASLSTVAASPGTMLNDGIETATVTLTVLDGSGNPVAGVAAAACVLAVTGTGNTVTQPTGVTNADGEISGSFVSTGAATKTCSFTLAGLAITDTADVIVSGSSDEPTFNVVTDTMLMGGRDGTFDTYADTAAMRSAWGMGALSASSLIAPGEGGAGNACRFTIPGGGGGEVNYGLDLSFSGDFLTTAADLVVTFNFRMSAGADFTSGRFGSSGTKWLKLYRDINGGILPRCTLGVHSLQDGILAGPADNGVQFEYRDQGGPLPGSVLQNVSKSVGWDTTNGQGTTNRTNPVNDGLWHRYTVRSRPADDYAEIWVDGVKTNSTVGLTYPVSSDPFNGIGIGGPIVPNMLTGYDMTMDIDDLQVFEVGA